ncbi:Tetratricopeptide repeat (TPR)-like superfamily protein [Zea mays]|uniref:Tetratricopeptide repeat (TPR)-like superfamily protein n=1 Tax=Zea mays TaxID=4577 RepID=A0A1D6HXA1_MAIZE|nr:Tetratricopeptide repeat (TPR)-like superfamily protein [Zea mays]
MYSVFDALLPMGVASVRILPIREKLKARRGERMLHWNQGVPELRTESENKSGKKVMDKKFLEKVEAVRRSALEKKKAEENKDYQAIDYDAPIESDKSTIGFGTRVGIGVAVVIFGLVFAFGDFLPYGSVSPSKESAVVKQKLSQEEEEKFKNALQGFQATLSKSPNDPTALEVNFHMATQGAAVSLSELGEYEKASTFLEKLIKVIPDKAEAYRLLGEVKFELKDYEGSSSSYRSALSVSKSSSDNIDFEVLRGLTNSLLAAKKPDEAVDIILLCRRKLNEKSQTGLADLEATNDNGRQKPQDIDPIQVDLLLGKAYSDWGHISDAISVYDKLITDHPEDFRGYLAKGIILKENGKAGDAERMFIQAKFFAPEAAKALVDRYAQR